MFLESSFDKIPDISQEAEQPILSADTEPTRMEIGPERTLEAFMDGRVLARVLENSSVTKGVVGFELSQQALEEELGYLEGKEGLSYASSTLIIPGIGIPLYHAKAAGWLFDGKESEIQHIASSDSGSMGGTAEDFHANPTEFNTLPELTTFLRAGPKRAEMNEVNARFVTKGLLGVVVRKAPSRQTLLEGIMTHKYMLQKGYEIPLFIYDQDKGALEHFQYTDEIVNDCLAAIKNEKARVVYFNAIQRLDEKGIS